MTDIPPQLAEIIDTFQMTEGREKLELLLEFAESLPPLPDWLAGKRAEMEPVPECLTPVFLHGEATDAGLIWHFDIPAESPTVRGYAGILAEGLRGTTPDQVIAVPNDFFLPMGLAGVISNQRLNGMSAILAHMKRVAVQQLEQA